MARAFTLVELLVVIGIIALLISVLLPALNKARAAAVTVSCLSRLRQLNTAVQLYASENRGFFPPIMEAANRTGGYPSWAGGPCVFPVKTGTAQDVRASGYLSKYLGNTKSASLYVCPSLAALTTNATNGEHSYKYNRYIGGLPDNWAALPNVTYSWSTDWRYCRPWQMARLRQASNFAVFLETAYIANFYGGGGNALWFRANADSERNGTAPFGGPYASPNAFHSPSPATGPHNLRGGSNIPGTPYPVLYFTMNVALADGSVRSVRVTYDRFPLRIPEVWVRPEHPTPTW